MSSDKMDRRRFVAASSMAASALMLRGSRSFGQEAASTEAHIDILPEEAIGAIAPEIYSHFIEQLGGVVYDGVWVGVGSKIPNHKGVRKDFIDTMRAVQAPVLRWPGGCFADSYDWRDGIGPANKRPNRAAFWGQQENNQYGLHEFMETCRAIDCRPYLAANLRTQPAREFYQMVEYCNAPSGEMPSNSAAKPAADTLAMQRSANGDAAPFDVRYWGVGNESWGCGGNQTPEEYAGEYRRYTAWLPSYGKEPLKLVAVGPNGDDVDWTGRMFRALAASPERRYPWGLSVHYYTSGDAEKFAAGDALQFDEAAYYDLLARGSLMEQVITDHWSALNDVDRDHKVKLVVDEWGAWYGKGTELARQYNLSQQSTMRDALLTAITLDIFQANAEKVAMANVAQSINCIHSLMLAQEDKFTVTPAFHVFQMYLPHRSGQAVRAEFSTAKIALASTGAVRVGGNSAAGSFARRAGALAGLSGSASVKGKQLTLSVVNPHLDRALTTQIRTGRSSIASATGTVLVSQNVHDHNDFAHPNAVKPSAAKVSAPSSGGLIHTFPPASVTTLSITLA